HLAHTARYAAFSASRQPALVQNKPLNVEGLIKQQHQWVDVHGQGLLTGAYQSPHIPISRTAPASAHAQPGAGHLPSAQLSTGFKTADGGLVAAGVRLSPRIDHSPYPALQRDVTIATDAGHASNDSAAADRIQQSGPGWQRAGAHSQQLGERVTTRAHGMDDGWRRP